MSLRTDKFLTRATFKKLTNSGRAPVLKNFGVINRGCTQRLSIASLVTFFQFATRNFSYG